MALPVDKDDIPPNTPPEYLAFKENFRMVVDAVADQPGDICDALFEKGYIPPDVRSFTRVTGQSEIEKARRLVDRVIDKIARNPKVFYGFVEILKGPYTDDVVKALEDSNYEKQRILLNQQERNSMEVLLPISSLSSEDRIDLKAQLRSDNMIARFATFVKKIGDSLESHSIPLQTIKDSVLNLNASTKDTTIKLLDLCDQRKIKTANSVSEVFTFLHNYISFFNYHVVEHLIHAHGSEEDRSKFEEYLSSLTVFCQQNIVQVSSNIFTHGYRSTAKILALNTRDPISTLDNIQELIKNVAESLKLSLFALQLCLVKREHVVELHFLISAAVADCIFPLSSSQHSTLVAVGVNTLWIVPSNYVGVDLQEEHEAQPLFLTTSSLDRCSPSATPECLSFQENYEFVIDTVKAKPSAYCDDLFAKGYITPDVRNYTRRFAVPNVDKARKLVDAVYDQIKQDPNVFNEFLELIKKFSCSEMLLQSYKDIKRRRVMPEDNDHSSSEDSYFSCDSDDDLADDGFVCPYCDNICTMHQFFTVEGCPYKNLLPDEEVKFPYLNLSALPINQRHFLQERLKTETREIVKKFMHFTIHIRESLEKRKVSLDSILDTLRSLEALEDVGVKLLEPQDIEKIQAATSISGVFIVLRVRKYFSFFNFGIIEHLVEYHGSTEDRKKLTDYICTFNDFCKRSVFKVPPNVYCDPPRTRGEEFVFKCTKGVATLDGVRKTMKKIAPILGLRPLALHLCSIKKGCVELHFMISAAVVDHIFPLAPSQQLALCEIGVRVLEGDHRDKQDSSTRSQNGKTAIQEATSTSNPMVSSHSSFSFKQLQTYSIVNETGKSVTTVFQHGFSAEYEMARPVDCGFKGTKKLAVEDSRLQQVDVGTTNGSSVQQIPDIKRRCQVTIIQCTVRVYDSPYYTKIYQVCNVIGKGLHISVLFLPIESEYEDLIKWLFKQIILINQDNCYHRGFALDVKGPSFQELENETSKFAKQRPDFTLITSNIKAHCRVDMNGLAVYTNSQVL